MPIYMSNNSTAIYVSIRLPHSPRRHSDADRSVEMPMSHDYGSDRGANTLEPMRLGFYLRS